MSVTTLSNCYWPVEVLSQKLSTRVYVQRLNKAFYLFLCLPVSGQGLECFVCLKWSVFVAVMAWAVVGRL